MDLFEKSTILKSYYIDALEFYNECIINNFDVPNPIEWLYNESYYRYNYNHLKYTTPKKTIMNVYLIIMNSCIKHILRDLEIC
jgi:hypothetical protein